MFTGAYRDIYRGDARWSSLAVEPSELFAWDQHSTYLRLPSFFAGMSAAAPASLPEIRNARVLLVLGDSVTTDHISPAGSIQKASPAGTYLLERGVPVTDFNSYGARRGNHEVMVRGTFANVRIRNRLVPEIEGPFTRHLPSNEVLPVYEAAMRYRQHDTPLLILAGKEYGSGSSRDWAAKGVFLQGVRVVIAESYERIHRSNLVGMGVLPLQYSPGASTESLGLTGEERFDIVGLPALLDGESETRRVLVRAIRDDGSRTEFGCTVRIDTPLEMQYYRHGGILQYVLRQLLHGTEEIVATPFANVPGQSPTTVAANELVDESSIESFPASDPPAY
jgi:aconitate hydratase A / 2-methylisocitrate dehydratase